MKARPILFSTPMVKALLEDRKGQTRRPVTGKALEWLAPEMFTPAFVADRENGMCKYGYPGDLLWVRETTEVDEDTHDTIPLSRFVADGKPVLYSGCSDPEYNGSVAHWDYPRNSRPSIHMERWASRLTLRITEVRVERLNAISEEDAMQEGCAWDTLYVAYVPGSFSPDHHKTYSSAYKALWESINGPGSWDANPWVWVISFEVIHANVDSVICDHQKAVVEG